MPAFVNYRRPERISKLALFSSSTTLPGTTEVPFSVLLRWGRRDSLYRSVFPCGGQKLAHSRRSPGTRKETGCRSMHEPLRFQRRQASAETGGLEIERGVKLTVGSNPTSSAFLICSDLRHFERCACNGFYNKSFLSMLFLRTAVVTRRHSDCHRVDLRSTA